MTFFIILVLIILGLWILWPWPAARWVNRSLPRTWSGRDGAFTLSSVAATPLSINGETQVRLLIPAGRVRTLLRDLTGRNLPPLVLRGGISAVGTFALTELGPEIRSWQAQATWTGSTPLLGVRLPIADVNQYMALRLAQLPDNPIKSCRLTMLRITDDDPPDAAPDTRRFAVETVGTVVWRALGMDNSITIDHCSAWIHLRFETVPGGRHPVATLEVTALETPVLSIPLIGQVKRLIIPRIQDAVDASLAARLADVVMPDWIPRDLRMEASALP